MRAAPVLFAALFVTSAAADQITGFVTKVTDGDTVAVTTTDGVIKVRLAEIDAPEKCQPFGIDAKQSLADLLLNREVTIERLKTDRYGRIIGHITGDFFDGTASAYQLTRGMAWVYDDYATDPTLDAIEQTARTSHIGVWQDDNPMQPWEWRRGKYSCKKPQ